MLEIVYDMAPGAELFFHDLGGNTVAFNSAIDDLVTAGCHIICDDIGWLLEPFYEDGTVASHIASVISANDIIYVSSAGNAGDSHYQGDFYSWSGNPNYHDFNGALTDPPFLYVNMPTLSNVIVILQWDEPFGSSGNDYNVYLYRIDSGLNLVQLVATSNAIQNGNDNPLEYFSYTRLGGASNFAVVVENLSGSNNNIEV